MLHLSDALEEGLQMLVRLVDTRYIKAVEDLRRFVADLTRDLPGVVRSIDPRRKVQLFHFTIAVELSEITTFRQNFVNLVSAKTHTAYAVAKHMQNVLALVVRSQKKNNPSQRRLDQKEEEEIERSKKMQTEE